MLPASFQKSFVQGSEKATRWWLWYCCYEIIRNLGIANSLHQSRMCMHLAPGALFEFNVWPAFMCVDAGSVVEWSQCIWSAVYFSAVAHQLHLMLHQKTRMMKFCACLCASTYSGVGVKVSGTVEITILESPIWRPCHRVPLQSADFYQQQGSFVYNS